MNKDMDAGFKRKRTISFGAKNKSTIDYKDVDLLEQFITEQGKILPRRITGVSHYHQKVLKKAIKRARQVALLPYVSED